MKKRCAECGDSFDMNSPEKKKAGGLSIHCPDCSEETAVRHAGVQAADAKQAGLLIHSFPTQQARDQFVTYWKSASGLHTGKNCQLGRGQPTSSKFEFTKIAEHGVGMNHKGKA
jgi:DNA-directed RNA polymerase subunit RPC12/RpoP